MEVTFDQHIGIFENAVPSNICNNVIKNFNQNIDKSVNRQDAEGGLPKIYKNDLHLRYQDIDIEFCKNFAHNLFKNILPLYVSQYQLNNLMPPIKIVDFKVQKTSPSGGYHVWHIEQGFDEPTSKRIMVYTLYLNDVEEGGETEFLIQSKRVKPKQGTVCIFPASYTHIHRGNPPLSGSKYIITGWLEYLENKP